MKNILGSCLLLCVVSGIALADRTDVWLASTVKVDNVELQSMSDGGCRIIAQARYAMTDGGTAFETSKVKEVSGANMTSCLDILIKAAVLFKTDKGL